MRGRRVAEVVRARGEAICELSAREVRRTGQDGMLWAGGVRTGGTANLGGIAALAEQVTGLPARVGKPRNMQGLVDTLDDPGYAASVGVLQWAVRELETGTWQAQQPSLLTSSNMWQRLTRWAHVLLPE